MDAKGCMVTPEVISGERSIQPSEATKVPEEVKVQSNVSQENVRHVQEVLSDLVSTQSVKLMHEESVLAEQRCDFV